MTKSSVEVLKAPQAGLDEGLVCTVVSFLPFEINEMKPGLIPGYFHIDAAVDGEPQLLYIGECMHYVYLDMNRGHLTVLDPAHKVAKAIVDDFRGAVICASPTAYPALWWEHGFLSVDDIKVTRAEEVKEHLRIQDQWYKALIADADDGWAKSHQHAMVSDLARRACDALGMEREWNIIVSPETKAQSCPACKSMVFPGAVVCPQCRCVLDREGYAKLQFADLASSVVAG